MDPTGTTFNVAIHSKAGLYPGQDCFDAEREQLATSILLVPATNLQRTTPIDSYFLHLPSHLCFEWSLCLDLQRYYQMRTLRGI
jgi:hypothetical protein